MRQNEADNVWGQWGKFCLRPNEAHTVWGQMRLNEADSVWGQMRSIEADTVWGEMRPIKAGSVWGQNEEANWGSAWLPTSSGEWANLGKALTFTVSVQIAGGEKRRQVSPVFIVSAHRLFWHFDKTYKWGPVGTRRFWLPGTGSDAIKVWRRCSIWTVYLDALDLNACDLLHFSFLSY